MFLHFNHIELVLNIIFDHTTKYAVVIVFDSIPSRDFSKSFKQNRLNFSILLPTLLKILKADSRRPPPSIAGHRCRLSCGRPRTSRAIGAASPRPPQPAEALPSLPAHRYDAVRRAYKVRMDDGSGVSKMAAENMLRPRAGGPAHVGRGGVQLPQLAEA